jgi:uncharacterized CHY-type Zn-finger protein
MTPIRVDDPTTQVTEEIFSAPFGEWTLAGSFVKCTLCGACWKRGTVDMDAEKCPACPEDQK